MQPERQPPKHSEVRACLARLIHEVGGIAAAAITDSAAVDRELTMASVAFVELCVAVEEEYNIEVDPIEVITLNRFSAIVDYVFDSAISAATWEPTASKQTAS